MRDTLVPVLRVIFHVLGVRFLDDKYIMNQKDNEPNVLYTGIRDMVPQYESTCSAGADLKANVTSALSIKPGQRVLVPTGLSLAIPYGWEGQIRARSGLAWKHGLTVLNGPGTIDADYRGEVKVLLINLGEETILIEPGQRIAQLVISRAPQCLFEYRQELPNTSRGTGGFGSTGQ